MNHQNRPPGTVILTIFRQLFHSYLFTIDDNNNGNRNHINYNIKGIKKKKRQIFLYNQCLIYGLGRDRPLFKNPTQQTCVCSVLNNPVFYTPYPTSPLIAHTLFVFYTSPLSPSDRIYKKTSFYKSTF